MTDLLTADGGGNDFSVFMGNGDGTFHAGVTYATGNGAWSLVLADYTGDGRLDAAVGTGDGIDIFAGNGDGTFRARTSYVLSSGGYNLNGADFNGDGRPDLIAAYGWDVNRLKVFLGNGDGTFSAGGSFLADDNVGATSIGDYNGDGALDYAVLTGTWIGNGGIAMYLGNGDGSFKARTSVAGGNWLVTMSSGDLNGDGILDLAAGDYNSHCVNVFIGRGDGTFNAGLSFEAAEKLNSLQTADLNADGVLDLVTGDANGGMVSLYMAETTKNSRIPNLDLATRGGALEAMGTVDDALQRISRELGAIGSMQSRFAVTLGTLSAAHENFSAAAGRIMDADVAQESSVLARTQILQQAGSAVLAQANQQPALALQLLR